MRNAIALLLLVTLPPALADAQTSWQETGGPYPGHVESLAINPSGHVFAGTGAGVFRSTDSGDHWTPINTGLTRLEITSLAVDPSGRAFAGTDDGGVFRSTDNGDTWAPVGLADTWVISLAIDSSGRVFAGTQNDGVFRSTDSGDSWEPVGPAGSGVICLAFSSRDHVLAGTNGSGLFRSTDSGDGWTPVGAGLTDSSVWSLAVDAADRVFAGTYDGGVFRSTDNGDHWTPLGPPSTWVLSLAASGGGQVLAGTFGGGALLSTDSGDSWTAANTGLTNTYVWSLAVGPGGRIFAGTGGGGVYRSVETVGLQINAALGISLIAEPLAGEKAIEGIVVVSLDESDPPAGTTVTLNGTPLTNWLGTSGLYEPDPANMPSAYPGGQIVLTATTGDRSQTLILDCPDQPSWVTVPAAGSSLSSTATVTVDWTSDIYHNPDLAIAGLMQSGLSIRPYDSASNMVFGAPEGAQQAVPVAPAMSAALTAGDSEGRDSYVLQFDVVGPWTSVGNGEGGANVGVCSTTSRRFFAAQSPTAVSEDREELPSASQLRQNRPNPFNAATNVVYSVHRPDRVVLVIYDVLGRPIRTLVDQWQAPGEYIVAFDAQGLASGVYFCRLLTASGSVQTRRMMLAR